MRLRDLGEFGLIERIARAAARSGVGAVVGIGDDAAVLRLRTGEDAVLTTDALVEGVHFRWERESPRHLGARAMAAALSDLAAMGARPLGVTLALAAPPALPLVRVDGVVRGILDAARRFGAPLVGGNVTRASETSLTLAALGGVPRGRALTRDRARAGDRICVTGTLGEGGLAVARGTTRSDAPQPRLAAGRALTRLRGVGGCIDVSDGLLADLGHLLRASRVGADLDVSKLPRARGFDAACRRLGLDPVRLAATGGEDYELVFTIRPGGPTTAALRRGLGLRVTEIGRVTARRGLRGVPTSIGTGWVHF
ncbi:MAG TPA: thiamine-phosphate kinase [Myxococcota bacterium]|nr:thiamine-phosphate kinase [Myxococcota bacterium]